MLSIGNAMQDNVFVRVVASVMYQVHFCIQIVNEWVFYMMLIAALACMTHGTLHDVCLLSTTVMLGVQVQDGKQAQYDAFYRLSNTEQQITSYVFDVGAQCTLSCAPQLLC